FIPDDDLGRFQLEQPLQPVVAVDHAAVQVVQIGGRETPAVERDQGPQLGGQHRQHFHDHPVRLDAGFLEAFEHFETLGELLDLGVGAGALELLPQSIDLLVEVDRAQQLANALGSHGGREIVSVLLDLGEVILLGEELRPLDLLVVDHARVGDDIDRKSTRLNSSHDQISYAVFCLKKKTWYYSYPQASSLTSSS